MNLHKIWIIARKEIFTFFDNPAAYLVLIIFVLIWEFMFFRSVFLIGEASARPLFDFLPWMLMFIAPAVTMGAFTQEKSQGTLELLLTHPVTILSAVIGKFISSWLFISMGLAFSLPVALSLSVFGALDWGAFLAQFLAGLILAAAFVSLGVYLSILIPNQIAALLSSISVSFFFIIVGTELVTANIPLALVQFFERLSVISHFDSLSRGVVDIRDIWYFISFVMIFLSLSYLQLARMRFGNRRDYYRMTQTGVLLFVGIALVTNVIGANIPGRIDLTSGHIYTLSVGTKRTLANLNDIVNITLYSSGKLPSQFVPVVRETKDMLKDYVKYGKGNINYRVIDPSQNPQTASEATSRGLQEIQFNVIGQEEFQVKTGFLGLVVDYGGAHESIPFIQETDSLEYQLTGIIAKLTNKNKKTVGFLSGQGEKDLTGEMQFLKNELEKQYVTSSIVLDDTHTKIASDVAILVVAGPSQELTPNILNALSDFIGRGKSILFALDGFAISPQSLIPTTVKTGLDKLLGEYGLGVNTDMAYDLRSNETVRMGQGVIGFMLPYPFWIRAVGDQKNRVFEFTDGVVLPWASTVKLDEPKLKSAGLSPLKLLYTSAYAGVKTTVDNITPDKTDFPNENLKQQLLAAAVEIRKQSGSSGGSRLILVGDSDFLTDQFVSNSPQNLSFIISGLSWLSGDQGLSGIPVRRNINRKLLFASAGEPAVIKYGNFLIVIVMAGVLVTIRVFRRRKLKALGYRKLV